MAQKNEVSRKAALVAIEVLALTHSVIARLMNEEPDPLARLGIQAYGKHVLDMLDAAADMGGEIEALGEQIVKLKRTCDDHRTHSDSLKRERDDYQRREQETHRALTNEIQGREAAEKALRDVKAAIASASQLAHAVTPTNQGAAIGFGTARDKGAKELIKLCGISFRELYYLCRGRKIDCIKAMRERLGLGLGDAKHLAECVDAHPIPYKVVQEARIWSDTDPGFKSFANALMNKGAIFGKYQPEDLLHDLSVLR